MTRGIVNAGLRRPLVGLLVALVLALANIAGEAPLWAHHTGAMYDRSKTLTLKGTVKEFLFTNPHCWVRMIVPTASGQEEWDIEASAPSRLSGWGLTPETLAAGDKITLTTHPLRDGRKGGSLVTLTLPNGKLVDTGSNSAPGTVDAAGVAGAPGAAASAAPADQGAADDDYPEPDDSTGSTWPIIGGAILLLALAIGLLVFIRRRYKTPGSSRI